MAWALSLQQANAIIAAALDAARKHHYKAMAVVVLDEAGHVKALQREDGASMARTDIATGKAWACVAMGATSRALGQRAKDNPTFFNALAVTHAGKFIAQTGAVPIRNPAGDIVGAVGASGGTGDDDEAICIAGLSAVGLLYE